MISYKKVKMGPRGIRYFVKDSERNRFKMIPEVGVPSRIRNILEPLEFGEIYNDDSSVVPQTMNATLLDRSCIFCGGTGDKQKLAQGQIVYLCDAHYYDMSVGKIVQKLKSL